MTDFPPPPDSSQPSQRRRPVVSFDEMVAIIVAFTTIGAILFWSWGVGKNKLFSQTWSGFKSTVEDKTGLQTDPNRISNRTRSSDRFNTYILSDGEIEETDIVVVRPESLEQLQPEDTELFSLSDRTFMHQRETAVVDRYPQPIIVAPTPTPSIESSPPETVETPTPPIESSPPETVETPIPPIESSPPETVETPIPPIESTPPETVETPTEPIVTFNDVPPEHWAYPFIEPLIEKELIVGISDDEFQPDLPITRAQFGAEIEKAFKQEKSRDIINFEDINQQSQTKEKIDEAVKTGFLRGYPGQIFRPDQQVPRLQVLVALVSGLDLKSDQDPETLLSSYQDADQIPDWAKEKVAIAVQSGLVINRPDFSTELLYPNESATRAEVVAMIYQALVQANRIEAISSPYVVPSP